jgi:hypothetical protein
MFSRGVAATTQKEEHKCNGCGKLTVGAMSVRVVEIRREFILKAAHECAKLMNSSKLKGKMIDMEKLKVNCKGKLVSPEEAFVTLSKPATWEAEWQPLTSEKAVGRSAYQLLFGWQQSNLVLNATDLDRLVFVPAELEAVESAAMSGEKKEVLDALSKVKGARHIGLVKARDDLNCIM